MPLLMGIGGAFALLGATLVLLTLMTMLVDLTARRRTKHSAVRLGRIKTPAIRERLAANRRIIHASHEQALALKQRHDEKVLMHAEAKQRWEEEFKAVLPPVHNVWGGVVQGGYVRRIPRAPHWHN